MKKQQLLNTIFIAFMLFATNVFAQNISTEYADRMNYIFANLEKNRVPNGILIDQSIDFIEVSKFSGQNINNENLVDIHRFRDIYYTLASGRMVSNSTMVSPQVLSTRFGNARQARTITLTGLYMKYAQFKDNAYSSNLVTIQNDQIYDAYNGSTWKNPYNVKEVFAIAPSVSRYKGKAIYVKLPSNLWFTNQSNVQWLKIDFNDGNGYQTVSFGQTKQILYSSLGKKEWKYKLRLTNGQTKYSHSYIQIEEAPIGFLNEFPQNQAARVVGPCPLGFSNGRQVCEIEADEVFQGQFGRAFVTVDYIGNNTTITKPLIVAEGLDMGHIMEPEALFGSSTILGFIDDVSDDNNNLQDLLFDNQEYDIIYVDWQNGTDRLERNALVLEAVIDWVNEEKTTNEPNVVIGQSMGGVIARYALRNMEDKNVDHETRLYISFDAPHQGANIPLAGQYGYQHMANWFYSTNIDFWAIPILTIGLDIDVNGALNLLDQPAPRQLLKNRVADNLNIENSMHTAWQNELENTGYPQQTERNIAISNGSECAITQAFSPGDELFEVTGEAKPSVVTSVITQLIPGFQALTSVFSSILLNDPAPLIGLAPGGRTKFEAEFRGKAQPLNQVIQIYKGRLTITKKVLWFINVNAHLTNESKNSSSSILPFDYYHGGEYGVMIDFDGLNLGGILGSANINLEHKESFDFIPTPSALDIGGGNTNLTNQHYLRAYSGGMPPSVPLQTPFDAYITAFGDAEDNEQHINILPRNGNFIASHLDDPIPDVFDCSAFCANGEINGPDSVCTSGTFSVGGFAGPITWSSGNTSIATINSSGVLTRTGNGVVTITADIIGQCGSRTIIREVNVGRPNIVQEGYIVTGPGYGPTPKIPIMESVSVAPNEVGSVPGYVEAEFDLGFSTSSSFNIISQTDYSIVWSYAENNNKMIVYLDMYNPNENIIFEITAQNACGTDSFRTGFYTVDEQPFTYRISPNPATDQLTIQFEEHSNQSLEKSSELLNSEPKTIRIADLNGRIWKTFEMTDRQTIDISELPSGAYQVIFHPKGGKAIRETLIVE